MLLLITTTVLLLDLLDLGHKGSKLTLQIHVHWKYILAFEASDLFLSCLMRQDYLKDFIQFLVNYKENYLNNKILFFLFF